MIRKNVFLLLLFCISLVFNVKAQEAVGKARIGFPELGSVKVRKAKEIKSSPLGIGCEVLDRDFADYASVTAIRFIRERAMSSRPASCPLKGKPCRLGLLMWENSRHGIKVKMIDGITYHGYPTNPDATFNDNLELVAFVRQYGKNIVARQGETGAPSTRGTSGALSNTDFNEVNQAKWDLRRALGTIGNNIPFSLFTLSEFNYPGNRLNTKGKLKINTDLSIAYAKQSYYGYQNLCSLFDSNIIPAGRKDGLINGNQGKFSLYNGTACV